MPAAQPAAPGNSQQQVRAALPAGGTASTQALAQPVNGGVRPALGSSGTFMVQIAAVSNQEDADVLTGALRKRGYTVTEKREPLDSLIHVRIGPFFTAAEANNWKNRLLNDGYNAVVQQ
jgi:DedD protein